MFKISVVIWKGWLRSNCLSAFSVPFFLFKWLGLHHQMREAVRKVVAAFPGRPEDCSPPSNTERVPAAFRIGAVHFLMRSASNRTETLGASEAFTNTVFPDGLNTSPECVSIPFRWRVVSKLVVISFAYVRVSRFFSVLRARGVFGCFFFLNAAPARPILILTTFPKAELRTLKKVWLLNSDSKKPSANTHHK